MKNLKFAIFGTGFWSRYQLAGWRELEGAECVALYNRTREKAVALGKEFGIEACYNDPERLLDECQPDFIDIITDVDTHERFSIMAAERGLPAICQKPLAPNLDAAQRMIQAFERAGKPLYVHENFRWQRPLRELKRLLDQGAIGNPWRARVSFCSSFPVFENQPFLKELDQFILTDVGTHILDVVRFLFGEAKTMSCQTRRINREIKGEDAATLLLAMQNGMIVTSEISYASRLADEKFPQTYIAIEGEEASIELAKDYWIRVTTKDGIHSRQYAPPYYSWADSRYEIVHTSIVPCNENLLAGLRGEGKAETTAQDNYETLRLVYKAYESAETGACLTL